MLPRNSLAYKQVSKFTPKFIYGIGSQVLKKFSKKNFLKKCLETEQNVVFHGEMKKE